MDDTNIEQLDGKLFADMVRGGAAYLRSNAQTVNDLNVFPVPDGDTGDNMSMTIESGVSALETASTDSLAEIAGKLAHGMLLGARGNSGVILSQLFAGMAKGFTGRTKADARVIGDALTEGVKMAYAAVLSPTEGTILTVAREATEYAVSRITDTSTVKDFFSDLISEMSASLKRTPELLAALKEAGVIDSGGAGLLYVIEGFNHILNGDAVEILDTAKLSAIPAANVQTTSFNADSVMEYGYCTELLLQLQNAKTDPQTFDVAVITEFLQTIGNSIVAFKADTIVKIHVHTLVPDQVLAFCRKYGEFVTVKIENMSVQHNETISDAARAPAPAAKPTVKKKKYGVVTVAAGDGIRDLFYELGADAVVSGGQTMNPSAEDFLKAFAEIPAETIFVLPNNSNIILAARQAAQIYEDATIVVLESKTLGDGYAAMSALNFEADDTEEIAAMLTNAMHNVATGCVTTSVRDTTASGLAIRCGDYIGFVGKEMLATDPSPIETSKTLLQKMHHAERDAITVFCGKDATAKEQEALQAFFDETTEAEIYFVDGGQDVYRFCLL